MYGTCLLTPPQKKTPGSSTAVIFSFYADVVNNAEVVSIVKQIGESMKESLALALRHVGQWKKFRALWKDSKDVHVAKWASKTLLSVSSFDQRLHTYRYSCLSLS